MPDKAGGSGQSTTPLVSVTDGRALVRLNRPREHNRLEPDDLAVLRETFTSVDADPSIRVLVLTGTGKSFSSGFHIGALADRLAGKDVGNEDREPSSARSTGSSPCVCRPLPRSTAASTAGRPIWHLPAIFASASKDAPADAGGTARHRLLCERHPALCDPARRRGGKEAVSDRAADRCGRDAADRLSRRRCCGG